MKTKGFITPFQLFASVVVTVIGVGIFSYPSTVTGLTLHDGWITTIISGIIVTLLILAMWKVVQLNSYRTFYDILTENLGGIFGWISALIFVVSNIVTMSVGIRIFSEVLKMYLLEKTSTELILLLMIISSIFLLRGTLKDLVRFNELSFYIMFIAIFIVLFIGLFKADFESVLPLFQGNFSQYGKAIISSTYSFAGFNIVFMILPFLKKKEGVKAILIKSIAFITFFYVFVTLLCIALLGLMGTSKLNWPTITMIKAIDIPGTFIERWEGVVMTLWVFFSYTTFVNGYYMGAEVLKDMLSLKSIKLSIMLLAPVFYFCALYPDNISEIYKLADNFDKYLVVFVLVVLTLLLLLISLFKKRRNRHA